MSLRSEPLDPHATTQPSDDIASNDFISGFDGSMGFMKHGIQALKATVGVTVRLRRDQPTPLLSHSHSPPPSLSLSLSHPPSLSISLSISYPQRLSPPGFPFLRTLARHSNLYRTCPGRSAQASRARRPGARRRRHHTRLNRA